MRRGVAVALLATIAAVPPGAAAKEAPDILEILDAFVLASAAASECAEPPEATLRDFLANFQMVATYAHRELNDRFPDRSDAEIEEAFRQRTAHLTRRVREVVDEDGCEAPRIRSLVRRFYASAEWKPGR